MLLNSKKKKFYEIYGYGINGYKLNKNIIINAGNSGTLARLILGLLVNSKKQVTIIGDKVCLDEILLELQIQ